MYHKGFNNGAASEFFESNIKWSSNSCFLLYMALNVLSDCFMMIFVSMFWSITLDIMLPFGLLVVSMIIFMMLVDVLLLGVLFSKMMVTCGS